MEPFDRVTRVSFNGPAHCSTLLVQVRVEPRSNTAWSRILTQMPFTSAEDIDEQIEALVKELRAEGDRAKRELREAKRSQQAAE